MVTKICIRCKVEKNISFYYKCSKMKSGYNNMCSECCRKSSKASKSKNKKRIKEYNKNYIKNNKESVKKWHREYAYKKYNEDIVYKFKNNIRSRLSKYFKRKSKSSIKLLGQKIEFVIEYLNNNEYGFKYGKKGIDIDHIIPLSSAKTQKEAEDLCHYTNLQLLPSEYNKYVKKDKKFNIKDFKNWLNNGYSELEV